MTAKRAFAYLALWAFLSAVLVVLEMRKPEAEQTQPTVAWLPEFDAEAAIAVELRAGERSLRCERSGERWRVVEPAGVEAPADLIASIVNALAEGRIGEKVSDDPTRVAEFGLDSPRARVRIETASGPPIAVALGSRNPAQTAVYARREGAAEIVLVGLNLDYYIDLALAKVRADQ